MAKRTREIGTVAIIAYVPDRTRAILRVKAAMAGVTMTRFLVQAMENYEYREPNWVKSVGEKS